MSVETTVHGNTLVITINRPKARNAINREVAEQVSAGIDRLNSDPDLLAGVITGADGHFCAGMDLKAFLTEGFPFVADRGLAGFTRAAIDKPMIAAVEGHAVAGGCEIALACDLIVAAESARFGLSEVCRGLVASEGGVLRLVNRLPHHLAVGMLLTGESITAERAARHGLVNRLTPDGQALTAALELATQVSRNAPLAVGAVRRIIRETHGRTEGEAWAVQDEIVAPVAASADAKEGAAAFAAKREPVWRGI
ncbi:enoyl-CoA hydratase [Pseudonocardiaceae bacterium YIM PH 21723]|nr:enoyl-CoA hydratase [Pseudonocardiaceae bacterium YIM PH 21723]